MNNPDDREQVNSAFLLPFVAFTTPIAMPIHLNTESVYVWTSEPGAVRINLAVSKLTSIGNQKL